jgi:hypothetical protein
VAATKILLFEEAALHLAQVPTDHISVFLRIEVVLRLVVGVLAVVEVEQAMEVSMEV